MNKNMSKQNSLVFLTNQEDRKNAMMDWANQNSHAITAEAQYDRMNGLWMVIMNIPSKELRDIASKKWK